MAGLLAEKLGMTQIFNEEGVWVPVTVLRAGPCPVVEKKTPEKHGYAAIQVAFDELAENKANKPKNGTFKKRGLKTHRHLKEFRVLEIDAFSPGQLLLASHLKAGDVIDVEAISKGKGFQGVMKRHHFSGLNASHGVSVSHRSPGSVGQRTYPGKIFKGKRMAGRMGNEKVTVKNLKVVGVEADQNLILVRGSVPGANSGLVAIYPRVKDFTKRLAAPAATETAPQ